MPSPHVHALLKRNHTSLALSFNVLKSLQIILTHFLTFKPVRESESVSFLEDHIKPAGRFDIVCVRDNLQHMG
jgi:hypothetical protein